MAKGDVVVSIQIGEKEVNEALKKIERNVNISCDKIAANFDGMIAKIEGSFNRLDNKKLSDTAEKASVGITKMSGSVDKLNQSFGDGLSTLDQYLQKIQTIASSNVPAIAKGSTARTTDATQVTAINVDVNQLNAALTPTKELQKSFADMAKSTDKISKNISALAQAKSDVVEAKTAVELAKQTKELERKKLLQEQTLQLAQRTQQLAQKNATQQAGQTFSGAMGMSATSINERIEKIKALQQVQKSLSTTDEDYANKLRAVNAEIQNLKRANAEALSTGVELEKRTNKLADAFANLGRRLLVYASIGAVTGFVKSLAQIRGQYELIERSLGAIIQDYGKATQIFKEQQKEALKSPFTLVDLSTATKQLAAYRIETDQLVPTTKMLADISAGLGVEMERLVYNFGQVKAQTVLNARDLRDFANMGLPLLQELAKYYGELEGRIVSTGEVFNMVSNRMVSFGVVEGILKKLTSEGGQFFNMQAIQAETLNGQLNNLKDAYQQMLNAIGKENQGVLSSAVAAVRALVDNWKIVLSTLQALIATYGVYRLAILASSSALIKATALDATWNALTLTKIALLKGTATATRFAATQNIILGKSMMALVANPYVVLAAAIAGVVTYLITINEKTVDLKTSIENLNESASNLQDSFKIKKDVLNEYDQLNKELKNTNLSVEDSENKHKRLQTVMANIARQTTPEIIEALDEYGNILSINTNKVDEYTQSQIEANKIVLQNRIDTTEKLLAERQREYDRYLQIVKTGEKEITTYVSGGTFGQGSYVTSIVKIEPKDFAAFEKIQQEVNSTKKSLDEARASMNGLIDAANKPTDFSNWQKALQRVIDKLDRVTYSVVMDKSDQETLGDITALYDTQNKILEQMVNSQRELTFETIAQRELQEKQISNQKELVRQLDIARRAAGYTEKETKKDILKEAIKDEITWIEKLRKEYDDLTISGKSSATTVQFLTRTFGENIKAINDNLKKIDQAPLDLNKIFFKDGKAIIDKNELDRSILNYLKIVRDSIKNKASDAFNDISLKIQELEVIVEKSKFTGLTESINQAFSDVKMGYELGIEIESLPTGMGSIFANMLKIDPKDIITSQKQLTDSLQEIINNTITKINELNETEIEPFKIGEISGKGIAAMFEIPEGLDEETKNKYNELVKALIAINDFALQQNKKYATDVIRNYQSILSKYGEFEYQRKTAHELAIKELLDIEKQYTAGYISESEKRIAQDSVKKKETQTIAKINFEEFTQSEYWIKSFENLDKVSTSSIKIMIANLKAFGDKNKEAFSAQELRAYERNLKNLEETLANRKPFDALIAGIKDTIKARKDLAALGIAGDYDQASDQAYKRREAAQKTITRLQEQLNTAKGGEKSIIQSQINYLQNIIDKQNIIIGLVDKETAGRLKTAAAISDVAGYVSQATAVLSDIGNTLFGDADTEGKEVFNDIIQSIEGVGEAAQGVGKIMSGDVVGGVIQVVGGLWKAVSGWFDNSDKRISRSVKKSEEAVKSLQNAYKGLERAVNKALGDAIVSSNKLLIANLELQRVEIQRQIQLEKSRKAKNRDAEKIAELEQQYKELGWQIGDIISDLRDKILGITDSEVTDNLASALKEAFKAGESGAEAWGKSVKEIINDMVYSMLVAKFLAPKIAAELDKYWETLMPKTAAAEKSIDKVTSLDEKIAKLEAEQTRITINKLAQTSIEKKVQQQEIDRLKKQREQAIKDRDKAVSLAEGEIPQATEAGAIALENGLNNIGTWFEDLVPYWLKERFMDAADEKLAGLQKGIANITEQTAGEIESKMNILTFNSYRSIELQEQQLITQQANLGVTSSILMQARESYQIMEALYAWTQNITAATGGTGGNGIKVYLQN